MAPGSDDADSLFLLQVLQTSSQSEVCRSFSGDHGENTRLQLQCVEIQDTSPLKVLLTHQLHLLKLQQLFSSYINQKDQAGVFILLPNVFPCFKIRCRFFLQDDEEDEQEEDDDEAFMCCHSDRHFLVLHQEAGSTMGLNQTGGSLADTSSMSGQSWYQVTAQFSSVCVCGRERGWGSGVSDSAGCWEQPPAPDWTS